jgi:general secretion pathway protein E
MERLCSAHRTLPAAQRDTKKVDVTSREQSFAHFLLSRCLLSETHVQQATQVSRDTRDPLIRSLAKLGFIPEAVLADALAEFTQLPRHRTTVRVTGSLEELSIEFLRHHALAPLQIVGEEISVAIANPLDETGIRGLEFATQRKVTASVATLSEVDVALNEVFESAEEPDTLGSDHAKNSMESLRDLASDAPAIRLVQRLITMAVDRHASDIHVEPTESAMKVRFRLDGVLQDVETFPASYASPLVSRVKVMAQLDIAERRLPQDGRLHITVNGKGIDFRVATSPTLHGESLVLRILDRQQVELDFTRLGFDVDAVRLMRSALQKPYGIILSTGPTGSGKTTTLYTALKELNRPDRKILTVEDPIEYMLEGINQTQVKPQIGYTFAAALRAFLRQDPDVLMVGEIRDRETAEVAIQAALTGHLLLSTLHTNTAAAAVTRLLDMGIDDFLLTSTLNVVIGQRLVRRLCRRCREPYAPNDEWVHRFALPDQQEGVRQLYRAVGCADCGGVGYSGRMGLLELLELSEPVRREILAHSDANAIEKVATGLGMRTMFRHGVELACRGETSVEEILRVTRSSD